MQEIVSCREGTANAVFLTQDALHVFAPQRTAVVLFLRTGVQASFQFGLLCGIEG